MSKTFANQSFTTSQLSAYLATQGISLAHRTILNKASSDPWSLPIGKKIAAQWVFDQSDVDVWIAAQTRSDRIGDPSHANCAEGAGLTSLDAVGVELGYFRRLRIVAVASLFSISRSCVWKRVKQGQLPAPLRDGAVTFWLAGEIAETLKREAQTYRAQRDNSTFGVGTQMVRQGVRG